mgnify:CR=1 FL=1
MTRDQQDAAIRLAEIILSASDNEATACPFWYIAVKGGSVQRGRNTILRGVWFSREEAEAHLRLKAHRYPKTAFVYCDSGHDSYHMRQMFTLAKQIAESDDQAKAEVQP